MKASELRIGNWIQHEPYPDEKWEIDNNLLQSIDLELVECVGIPLTHEILESCGFEVFPWGYVKKSSKDFGVRINLRSFNYDVSGNSPVKIEYLHQLQNLYFALTGEELEINI